MAVFVVVAASGLPHYIVCGHGGQAKAKAKTLRRVRERKAVNDLSPPERALARLMFKQADIKRDGAVCALRYGVTQLLLLDASRDTFLHRSLTTKTPLISFCELFVCDAEQIDLEDLRILCLHMGYLEEEAAGIADAYMEKFDASKNGTLNFNEFMTLYAMLRTDEAAEGAVLRLAKYRDRMFHLAAAEAARRTRNRVLAKSDPNFYSKQEALARQAAR